MRRAGLSKVSISGTSGLHLRWWAHTQGEPDLGGLGHEGREQYTGLRIGMEVFKDRRSKQEISKNEDE